MKIVVAIFAFAAVCIGSASAQAPIGQAPVYSPPTYSPGLVYTAPQQPVWSPPVTGHAEPMPLPPPKSSWAPPPVYSPPVTGTVNPYAPHTR